MEFAMLDLGPTWDPSLLFSSLFPLFRMGISVPCLSHHFVWKHITFVWFFIGSQLERSFVSRWIPLPVSFISELDIWTRLWTLDFRINARTSEDLEALQKGMHVSCMWERHGFWGARGTQTFDPQQSTTQLLIVSNPPTFLYLFQNSYVVALIWC